MCDPALVIHGVANRDGKQFDTTVKRLAIDSGRDPASLVPVFWGDLGAAIDGLADTIPGAPPIAVRATVDGPRPADVELAVGLLGDPAQAHVRTAGGGTARAHIVGDGFEKRAQYSAGAVRGTETTKSLRASLEEAWLQTKWLSGVPDEDLLRELGAAIAEAAGLDDDGAEGRGSQVRGRPLRDAHDVIKRIVNGMDHAVGAILGHVGSSFNHFLRETFAPKVGNFLGDVLVYQRHREKIQARVRDKLKDQSDRFPGLGTAERPVAVLGHSLGGVIAFDLATSITESLSVSHLITFGSQSPFLHILDPRLPVVATYVPGRPSTLPDTINAWTNLWEPRDPLAFIAAKVFVMASGTPPTDIAVGSLASSGLWTHSSYWALAELAEVIRHQLQ